MYELSLWKEIVLMVFHLYYGFVHFISFTMICAKTRAKLYAPLICGCKTRANAAIFARKVIAAFFLD